MGPSGSGKTTLLRLLARLDEPTLGEIRLDGRRSSDFAPRQWRRGVGLLFQQPTMFPGTLANNLRFGPRQRGVELADDTVERLLEDVGLAGKGAREATTLSGGEAQRAALARTLANRPRVLLLDEPTSALDGSSRDDVESLLTDAVAANGLACVWVTHDPAQANRVAKRVLRLREGREERAS